MSGDLILQFLAHSSATLISTVRMHDKRQRIHFLFVDQNIQFYKFGRFIALHFIVKGCISTGSGFECVEKVINNLIQRQFIFQHSPGGLNIICTQIASSSFLAQLHNRPDKFGGHHDLCTDNRFFHVVNFGWVRQIGGIGQFDHLPICFVDTIYYSRCRGNQIQVIFSLQTFLNNLQMQ